MAGFGANADALLKAVKERTGNSRIHTLINTHWHPEQTGANEAVGRDGGVIFAHEKTQMYLSNTVTFGHLRRPPAAAARSPRGRIRPLSSDGSLMFAGQQRRLRLPAGSAHRRRSLCPLSRVERAGRRRRCFRRRMAAAGLPQWRLAGRPRPRLSNDSRTLVDPILASCPPMAV